MILKRLGLASLVIGLGLGSAACTDGYGYSGVNVGYASGYGDYYDDGFGGYGNGYYGAGYGGGLSGGYFGWYGDYYYPGNGIYVYDRYRRPYRWNDGQRRYWEGRRGNYRGDRNWNGFDRDGDRRIWNGNRQYQRNDGMNRGDRTRGDGTRTYSGNRGDRSTWRNRDGAAATTRPRETRTEQRSFTPRADGQQRSFTPRTEGQQRGWRGRSRGGEQR
jgi:hypothetical protein